MGIELKDWFIYHPCETEERKLKHDEVNKASLELAKVIQKNVTNPKCSEMAFFAIQQAKMFANQGITIDFLNTNVD